MLLPYNVDRPARRTPSATYALMAVNIAIYLLTVSYSTLQMHAERPAFNERVAQLQALLTRYGIDSDRLFSSSWKSGESGLAPGLRMQIGAAPGTAPGSAPSAPAPGGALTFKSAEEAQRSFQAEFDRILPPSERRNFSWNQQHRRDLIALDTHPDVMDWLAYTPGKPTMWGLFTAMFLHSDLDHIAGNMLFLWVFGRAVEDTLGRGIFVGAYFVCGFAATLLYHVMTRAFSPAGMLIPSLGASGAISGVQGLFAPRFYRTPVRVFYTRWWGIPIFYLGVPLVAALLGLILAGGFGLGTAGFTLATLLVTAGFVLVGNETLWREWKVAAAWLIAGWVTFFDLIPIAWQAMTGDEGGGVAHWAHVGGLLCGVAYAFLIGSPREGKTEYLVDSARQSLDMSHAGNALESAQQVVMMKPEDPVGYQLLAQALDGKDKREQALQNYKIALDKYLRRGERSAAAAMYQGALLKHADWVPEAPVLFALASQMARDENWKGAAENLAKLPYYYPQADEGEMAFLRSSQLYVEKLDQPQVAMQLLTEFKSRFPNSQWMDKATKMYQAAEQGTRKGKA